MAVSTILLFTLNRFSNGRRLFVLLQVLKMAQTLGNAAVLACVNEALAHERATRELERRWRTVRGTRTRSRGNAAALDVQIDRVLGAMFRTLEDLLVPLDPTSEHAAQVRGFLDTYFPEGAEAITHAEFEDALAITEEMIEDFAELPEEELKSLNITYHVKELARLVPQFATELERPTRGMRFATLRAARVEGHEQLCELVATIIAEYRGRDADKIDARTALLTPIVEANDRVTARRRRRNGPDVDVDPNTGEELAPGQDLVDEADASGRGGVDAANS